MADYGVLLTNDSGNVWVSPQSIPLALLSKQSITLKGGTNSDEVISVTYDTAHPCVPFVVFHGASPNGAFTKTRYSGNTCSVVFSAGTRGIYAEVYFFSVFPQPNPGYGLAIWDENGTLILTNETRTLSDVQTYGTGYNLNVTNGGKWAVSPVQLGAIVGVINDPLPRPFEGDYCAAAFFNGGSTQLAAYLTHAPGGTGGSFTYVDMKNTCIAINCARYD
ncbi:membrane associated protein [Klebsiella phage vB_KpnS_Call]|uniref:Uncharacterized protein n=1 Tax=Klebsiella phage vB_KpnS_Call TaxID=2591371 RepID=A0A5B9NE27_9CAUD|nr:membrane associated protein [Klebsiella phage vB_KpnS_Call]QEG12474.1 hypothetical protein gp24 [Klebsiella phage vB_KpnS_Call]